MNHEWFRSLSFAVLLAGFLVVAFPQANARWHAWLFPKSPALTAHSAVEASTPHDLQTPPTRTPQEFAFDYEADPRVRNAQRDEAVTPSVWTSPANPQPFSQQQSDLTSWQQELERWGAKFIVVEALGHEEPPREYQCRCIVPVSEDGSLEKVCAANAAHPALAMQQVCNQVKIVVQQRRQPTSLLRLRSP